MPPQEAYIISLHKNMKRSRLVTPREGYLALPPPEIIEELALFRESCPYAIQPTRGGIRLVFPNIELDIPVGPLSARPGNILTFFDNVYRGHDDSLYRISPEVLLLSTNKPGYIRLVPRGYYYQQARWLLPGVVFPLCKDLEDTLIRMTSEIRGTYD